MGLNKFTIQKSFAISAGAGSGKTYTLSRRYINAILGFDYFREDYKMQDSYFQDLKPAKVNQVVTITYTEAAALEMKGRIFGLINKILNFKTLSNNDGDYDSIEEANNSLDEKRRKYVLDSLDKAYKDSSNSKISTIHSFCLDIIKVNSDIAKIDSNLNIIKENEKQKELSQIIFEVLNSENNKEKVLRISENISMFLFYKLIEKYVNSSKFRKEYDSFSKESIRLDDYKKLIFELYPLPNIDDVREELREDSIRLNWFEKFYNNYLNFNATNWKGVDETTKAPSMGKTKFPLTDTIKKELESSSYLSVYSYIDENKEDLFFSKIEDIKNILHQIKNRYDTKLLSLEQIDFDTIITKTLEIMPSIKTDFKYIMVDEFQDTNATQFEIVKEACNKDTNLFVVGDSKQSIYSFQGAEIEVFNDSIKDKNLFYSVEDMSRNFRSDKVVLDSVNTIFKELLLKDKTLNLVSQNYEASAQDLHTTKEGGTFNYLITSQPYNEEVDELDSITNFIAQVCIGQLDEYKHITKLIDSKEKAIAIIFDSSTKMVALKQKLVEKGIVAKTTASDNFYHTKEILDIFHTLKAIEILSRKKNNFTNSQKFYLVGALRSNIVKCNENEIKKHLDSGSMDEKLLYYVDIFKKQSLTQAIKYIYDDSNIIGTYVHFDDLQQRVSNLYKFLTIAQEYENLNDVKLYNFLTLIENSIYFSETKEDEAFFISDNTKSIEICSIHSTKGLAYPLVLLANSDKSLYSQIQSDSLKHNNFTMLDEKKEIVGFKIGNYTPLSHRVLKAIDKRKHLAEKKRLLYVALTRAENDVVISAILKSKKDGGISFSKDSYLYMIVNSFGIEIQDIFEQNIDNYIKLHENTKIINKPKEISYVQNQLKPLNFSVINKESATQENISYTIDKSSANLGTLTHKIIELYWKDFKKNQEQILNKMLILDEVDREKVVKSMDVFYASDIYKLLINNIEHKFELEFNYNGKIGFIDFIYYNKEKAGWVIVDFKTGNRTEEKEVLYREQLNFYTTVMEELNYVVVDSFILWL